MYRRRFSHSLVSLALECPRKAYYRYVEKVPTPTPAPFIKGRAMDAACNLNMLQKIDTHEDLSADELLNEAQVAWDAALDEVGGPTGVEWRGSTATDERRLRPASRERLAQGTRPPTDARERPAVHHEDAALGTGVRGVHGLRWLCR